MNEQVGNQFSFSSPLHSSLQSFSQEIPLDRKNSLIPRLQRTSLLLPYPNSLLTRFQRVPRPLQLPFHPSILPRQRLNNRLLRHSRIQHPPQTFLELNFREGVLLV